MFFVSFASIGVARIVIFTRSSQQIGIWVPWVPVSGDILTSCALRVPHIG